MVKFAKQHSAGINLLCRMFIVQIRQGKRYEKDELNIALSKFEEWTHYSIEL